MTKVVGLSTTSLTGCLFLHGVLAKHELFHQLTACERINKIHIIVFVQQTTRGATMRKTQAANKLVNSNCS